MIGRLKLVSPKKKKKGPDFFCFKKIKALSECVFLANKLAFSKSYSFHCINVLGVFFGAWCNQCAKTLSHNTCYKADNGFYLQLDRGKRYSRVVMLMMAVEKSFRLNIPPQMTSMGAQIR